MHTEQYKNTKRNIIINSYFLFSFNILYGGTYAYDASTWIESDSFDIG